MSKKIGVRELKNHTSGVIQEVRETMAEYVVTIHDRPVAVIRPYAVEDEWREREEARQQGLAAMKRLAGEVAAAWTSPRTAVELVAEQRR